jgi:hypothetical protein
VDPRPEDGNDAVGFGQGLQGLERNTAARREEGDASSAPSPGHSSSDRRIDIPLPPR